MSNKRLAEDICNHRALIVKRKYECIGYKMRNLYAVTTGTGDMLASAVQELRVSGWRDEEPDINMYDCDRNPALELNHPFRWWFKRLEVWTTEGHLLGALQQRFSLLTKSFDVEDAKGRVRMTVSGLHQFSLSTDFFSIMKGDRQIATFTGRVQGLLRSIYSEEVQHRVEYQDGRLTVEERQLILVAALFIDRQYFDKRGSDQSGTD